MGAVEIIGYVSIIILNLGWWIQVCHVLKTRHVKGISRPFLSVMFSCFIFLQYYTWTIHNWVYLVGNGIGMAGVGVLLVLTEVYREKDYK